MDVIERWFGIAPDGGSGALEVFLLALLVALAAALIARARRRAGHRETPWRGRLAHWADEWSRGAELRDAE
jgi:hypothetical protein